ncbi:MAG: hypothetical protein L3J91_05545, partial [Thermoplasmata archaeon]|nr:hypothetical protein [Thermoplasmata archaeon]
MHGPAELLDVAHEALDGLPYGWQGDVRVLAERWGTMRLALGRLNQPHLEEGHYVSLRVVHDHHVGIAAGSDISARGLRRLASTATGMAGVAPADPNFPPFPAAVGPIRRTAYSATTARLSPERQAKLADEVLAGARSVQPAGRVAGAVNVGSELLAVANTSGLERVGPRSLVQVSVLVDRPELDVPVSGWDEGAHWNVDGIAAARLGRAAAERVATSVPESAPAGRYRVLFCGP